MSSNLIENDVCPSIREKRYREWQKQDVLFRAVDSLPDQIDGEEAYPRLIHFALNSFVPSKQLF